MPGIVVALYRWHYTVMIYVPMVKEDQAGGEDCAGSMP